MYAMNCKIFCRSFDLRLYERSRAFYAQTGLPVVRLTDQTADGYFYSMLADKDCDIAINVDEDCFVADMSAVLRLVQYVVDHGYANAGCPDGGGATPRNANPIVTNPFFNILNLKLIRETCGDAKTIRQAVREFDISAHLDELKTKTERLRKEQGVTTDNLLAAPKAGRIHPATEYRQLDVEPYYPFFFWLAWHFDTLYLPSFQDPDGWTTILASPGEWHQMLCAHTWLARFYAVPDFMVRHWQPNAGKQKQRIDAVISRVALQSQTVLPEESFADTCRYLLDKLLRWLIKIPQRIANWPNKLRKKLCKS